MISNTVRGVHAWLLLTAILLTEPIASAQYGIRTYAGGGPDNIPAVSANVGAPYGVAVDAAGNIYASAYLRHQVYKITPGGTITVFAGNGQYGFYGDGGAAKYAALSYPQGLALDPAGNLYIADSNNNRVRKVDATTGVISTVAGGGPGLNGDGGIATDAQLGHPSNIIFEADGTMYIADTANARVRRVDPVTNIITTYAGGGSPFCCGGGFGDGQQATNSKMYGPEGLALDSSNNLYIADPSYGRIRKVTKATGIISTVAGSGLGANAGDNGPATSAILQNPVGVAVDSNGDIYIGVTQYIRKVSGGTITKVAGVGGAYPDLYNIPLTDAQIGNGGGALTATLSKPAQLTLHPSGGVVFADTDIGRIRKLSGVSMLAVAGTGWFAYSGDGFLANRASLYQPMDLTLNDIGDLLIAENGKNSIRRVSLSNGFIDTILGNGLGGTTSANNLGEGGPSSSARVNSPRGIDHRSGRLTLTDPNNYRVRQSASGVINKIAGTGYSASVSGGGDGTATAVGLYGVYGTVSDAHGNVFITDGDRVRAIANGKIVTIAGSICGSSGDGGPAINAKLCAVQGIARDSGGALYIADSGFHKIRKITGLPSGLLDETGCSSCVITTIAGTGSNGFSGDGGAATSAALFNPQGVAVDASLNVYIADTGNNRIRKIDTGGTITTIAGNGVRAYSNDGYAATTASLAAPSGVAVDSTGTVYVADSQNHRIRALTPGVFSVTVASSPAGLPVTVDGTTYTAPQTFSWATGSTHTIAAFGQTVGGTKHVFAGWSDSGAASHTVSPNSGTTYTATYSTQYYLTTSSNQPAMGSIAPASGWYNSGSVVAVSATPVAGHAFTGFSGALSGTTNPQNVSMTAPRTVSASFAVLTTTVTTSPAGLAMVVDGVNYVSPQVFQWTPGSNHSISVAPTINVVVGTRHLFQNWSDAGAATHNVTGPAVPTTFTATYQTQHQLTTGVSPAAAGTVSAPGWYAAGATAIITSTANAGYAFANYSGFPGGPSGATPLNLVMNAPRNVVANFTSLAPVLTASLATKSWDVNTQTESVTIKLQNSGLGNAVDAQITSVVATVFQGSGVLGVPTPASQVVGTIAPASSANAVAITFTTPSTVIRIKLVVNYTSTGGVPASTSLIFFK